MRSTLLLLIATMVAIPLLTMPTPSIAQNNDDDGPSRLELDGAEYRIEQLEEAVRRANGAPFQLGHLREALVRISDLRRRYPDNPRVQELFERARAAFLASRGTGMEITEEMLAYRENSERIRQAFLDLAAEEWTAVQESVGEVEGAITDPFPAADPLETDHDEIVGKPIILEGIQYPMGMFEHLGQSYIAVGRPSTGMYFVSLSGRGWRGAYEAVRRYRRLIGGELPQNLDWTIAGEISGVQLAVPVAGEEPVADAVFGWTINVTHIYIPGFSLTMADSESDTGGMFVGEDRVEEIKGPFYSTTEISEDASPTEVLEAYITAIKERNFDFWLELTDPARIETGPQMEVARYHWDWHMKRWWEQYCAYQVDGEPLIEVVRGEEIDPLEAEFLTPEEREELERRAGPIERLCTIRVKLFNDRGQQQGSPKNFYLRQYQDGRWWVAEVHLPS